MTLTKRQGTDSRDTVNHKEEDAGGRAQICAKTTVAFYVILSAITYLWT